MKRLLKQRLWRWLFVAYGVLVFVGMAASVQLSTRVVPFGSLVFGAPTLWRGHSAALRVLAVEPQGGRPLAGVTAELTLRDGQGERWRQSLPAGSIVDVEIPVPLDLDPYPTLDVTLRRGDSVDAFQVALKSSLKPPPLRGRLLGPVEVLARGARPATQAGLNLTLYPEAGYAVAGLKGDFWARLLRDGQPHRARVALESQGITAQTDELGITSFALIPALEGPPLRFSVGHAPAVSLEMPLAARPAQLVLHAAGPIVAPGTQLGASVRTLPFRDPVHVDLWVGGALLQTRVTEGSATHRQASFTLPPDVEGFVRLDAYRNPATRPEHAVGRLVWVSARPALDAAADAIAALRELPSGEPLLETARDAPPDVQLRLLPLLLGRHVAEPAGRPLLRSTLSERQAARDALVSRQRGYAHVFLAIVLLLAAATLLARVVTLRRDLSADVERAVAEGLHQGEAVDRGLMQQSLRLSSTGRVSLALLLLTLMLAGCGVYILLTHLRWV